MGGAAKTRLLKEVSWCFMSKSYPVSFESSSAPTGQSLPASGFYFRLPPPKPRCVGGSVMTWFGARALESERLGPGFADW